MQRDADGIAALDPAPEHRFPAKRVRRWNTSLKARALTKQAIYQLAMSLKASGHSPEEVYVAVIAHNERYGRPLTDREITDKALCAMRWRWPPHGGR